VLSVSASLLGILACSHPIGEGLQDRSLPTWDAILSHLWDAPASLDATRVRGTFLGFVANRACPLSQKLITSATSAAPRRERIRMRVLKLVSGAVLLFLVLTGAVLAQKKYSASEAKDHVGENATVCGAVASTRYAASSRGQPTFLNLDQPYPNQIFTILIWGNDRSKFGRPEVEYRNKRVCVTGTISLYRGVPEIIATVPSQIEIRK